MLSNMEAAYVLYIDICICIYIYGDAPCIIYTDFADFCSYPKHIYICIRSLDNVWAKQAIPEKMCLCYTGSHRRRQIHKISDKVLLALPIYVRTLHIFIFVYGTSTPFWAKQTIPEKICLCQ